MSEYNFEKEPVWRPDEKSGERMKAFMKSIEDRRGLQFNGYWDFHKWTVENIPEFWADLWDFSGIIFSKPYDKVLLKRRKHIRLSYQSYLILIKNHHENLLKSAENLKVIDLSIPMEESPEWFEEARLNTAENLLKFRDDRIALIAAENGEDFAVVNVRRIFCEEKAVEYLSFNELYEETRIYAAALRKMGLQIGDRVACYMSNRAEAVIAMLAVTSIGAIWTGGLPTLGSNAFLNRVRQVQPKFLFTIDQFPYNKEKIHLLKNIKEITDGLPSLEKVIIIPSKGEAQVASISEINHSCFLEEFKRIAYDENGTLPDLVFEQVSFSHPVFISYTSGTTGLPKTIVHGFGGILTTFRDFGLHFNGQPNDVWLSMTAVGWASWNFAVNWLFIGSTVVLFEGVPYFLTPTYLWDLVDALNITRIVITPTNLDKMEDENYVPTKKHHLSSLKTILCGGSVVKPRNYIFGLNKIKEGLEFVVGCGSTEVMGVCLVSEQSLPVYLEEISSPSLGVALECLDDEGKQLLGKMGEHAVSKPMPSLPTKMWGDRSGELYKKTYFSKYAGKFTIGDSIIINPLTRGIIVCGRSDETLNQRGCRFGSSEIYNVVMLFPEIKDCLCVGQYNKERVERAILFIQMKEGSSFNEDLRERLGKCITKELTERHVPAAIIEAPGIPYNSNGKKTEIIVKKIINKMPHNPETVANSECLQFYYNLPELEDF